MAHVINIDDCHPGSGVWMAETPGLRELGGTIVPRLTPSAHVCFLARAAVRTLWQRAMWATSSESASAHASEHASGHTRGRSGGSFRASVSVRDIETGDLDATAPGDPPGGVWW